MRHFCQQGPCAFWNLLIVCSQSAWPLFCSSRFGRRTLAIKLLTPRYARATFATAAAVAAFAVEAVAQVGGGWFLVAPPPIPEKRALVRVYAASSDAEVQAAVDSLPNEKQILLVTKVYKILMIPTVVARTEALLEALQDTSAPVSKWRQIDAFDSAELCERDRQRALQGFERAAARLRSLAPESEELPVEGWGIFEGLSACRRSRCVPESAFFPR